VKDVHFNTKKKRGKLRFLMGKGTANSGKGKLNTKRKKKRRHERKNLWSRGGRRTFDRRRGGGGHHRGAKEFTARKAAMPGRHKNGVGVVANKRLRHQDIRRGRFPPMGGDGKNPSEPDEKVVERVDGGNVETQEKKGPLLQHGGNAHSNKNF